MDIWSFLSDPQNRAILAWLGGGFVVVAGGAWTAIQFFATRKPSANAKNSAPSHRVSTRDGIAAGGNVTISTRNGLTGWQPVLLALAIAGAVLLGAAFAGNRVTANNGAAVNGGVVGDVIVGVPAPPGK